MDVKSPIELRHLRYFVRVAGELHFGRAAERLGICQAPLSQQIRHLEDMIGVRLFDRTTRSVSLTAAGKTFLVRAQAALANIDDGLMEVQNAIGKNTGRLVIGAMYLSGHQFLPEAVRQFLRRYPNVSIDIRIMTTEEQIEAMEQDKIHVGFVRPPRNPGGFSVVKLASEGFVAVLAEDNPLAAKPKLKLADLRDEPFLVYTSVVGVSFQNVMFQHCRRAGFSPRIVQEVSHAIAIVAMVAAGVGVGVIPAWVSQLPYSRVVYRPLPELPKVVDLAIAWPAHNPSPFIREFVSISRDVAAIAMRDNGG
ncbi:LysR family transcriptional regulator [Shumkonia mesophila]|uniref:LysR family transcriptional regulator n=1 Tax=Shumkonia mesophila TaxID=2838854 RepID=UPI002934D323|nr:LysR substrate-binding domain-containing protein [Shumkonia mesophila]